MPRFQFRIRTVFILVTACAILFALLGSWWGYKAEKQRKVMEALNNRPGVHVHYANGWRAIEAWFETRASDDDIRALQELDGLKEVTALFDDEARFRGALPNCKFDGHGLFAAP
ncbi:MAG: hypothetical protein K8T91_15835 [Planctomycetes bacterium]|nr:hypothetical protein [Planctomycetota bacterium]